MYLITVATQTEEPSLRNDVPEDDIAILAARSEDGARGAEAEGGGRGAVAVEGCLAGTCFRVPQPDAPIRVPARNLYQTKTPTHEIEPNSNAGTSQPNSKRTEGRESRRGFRGTEEETAAEGEEAMQETASEREEEEGAKETEGRPRLRSQAARRSRAAVRRRRPEGS